MSNQKQWSDLTDAQKMVIIFLGVLQMALLGAALRDLRRRPAEEINGRKGVWAVAAFVNFIGPIAYFLYGRKVEPAAG